MWAMTTVVGPILGPILGGSISDNWSWHWIFFINIPVGVLCAFGAYKLLRGIETPTAKIKIDAVGLALLVIWIGALQLMLDLGHEYDWFNSGIIIGLAITTVLGFIVFMIWELTDQHPVVNVRIFRYRGFSIATLSLAFAFAAFFGSIVLIPQWLQFNMGYTATWAGYLTATMGFGSLTMSPIVAKMATKYDQRALACFGLIVLGLVTLMRAFWSNQADFMALALPQIIQGFAVPFFFIPLSNLALGAVRQDEMASAAGLMNFVRTMAGAIGASAAVTLWDDFAKSSRSDMVGTLNTQVTQQSLMQHGFSSETALGVISSLVDKEALTLSVNHVFFIFAMIFIFAGLIIWLCPKPKNSVGMGQAH